MQNKYKNIKSYIKKQYKIFSLHKKIFVFAIIATPVTSTSVAMTLYVDNTSTIIQAPILQNEPVMNLDEPLTVTFEEKIKDTKKYESMISTYPSSNLLFFWRDNNTTLKIVPKTIWKPSTTYSIAFPYNSYGPEREKSILFSFETISYPTIINTNMDEFPGKYLKKENSIIFTFDRDISDFDIDTMIRPSLDVTKELDLRKNELTIKITEIKENDPGFHEITFFAKHSREQKAHFFPIASTSFNILIDNPTVWPQEHLERLAAAKLSTMPKRLHGKYIDINLEAQITTLFDNGKFIKNFVSSTGATETPTPTGEFHIYHKHPYALSKTFNVFLPYWMAFTEDGKYGLHDLVVWPEGHKDRPAGGKESVASIGNAVSPGCVRHNGKNAQFIYNWSDVGTIVLIY